MGAVQGRAGRIWSARSVLPSRRDGIDSRVECAGIATRTELSTGRELIGAGWPPELKGGGAARQLFHGLLIRYALKAMSDRPTAPPTSSRSTCAGSD